MKEKSGFVAFTGILAALALCLSFLEGLLPPLPMAPPGARLGLSNIAAMYAAGSLGLPCALFLSLCKGGFAFLSRGAAAGVLSLSGGLCSAFISWLLLKKTRASLSTVGVCSALTHNAAQLCAARVITASPVFFYIPFLMLFGILTGLMTGLILKVTLPPLQRVESLLLPGKKE